MPAAIAGIPFAGPSARVTHIITEIGQTRPQVEQILSQEGRVRVAFTAWPVFIEGE